MSGRIRGVLFDKDGTLFNFAATWEVFAANLLNRLAQGDPAAAARAAEAIGFDRAKGRYRPDSPAIAGTNREVAGLLAGALGQDAEVLEAVILEEAARAPLVEAVPLSPLMQALRARGLALGVMTNDSEAVAQQHLRAGGVLEVFDFVAGADSGFGAKPDPAPLLAFAEAVGLPPAEIVMVGDSTHDLIAGRAAGMGCVGVLTGMAPEAELAPHADVVLADIGALPAWLGA